jgi:hypothetical protein
MLRYIARCPCLTKWTLWLLRPLWPRDVRGAMIALLDSGK